MNAQAHDTPQSPVYRVEVTETIAVRKVYWIQADSPTQVRAMAEIGDTVQEETLREEGVLHREVTGVPTLSADPMGDPEALDLGPAPDASHHFAQGWMARARTLELTVRGETFALPLQEITREILRGHQWYDGLTVCARDIPADAPLDDLDRAIDWALSSINEAGLPEDSDTWDAHTEHALDVSYRVLDKAGEAIEADTAPMPAHPQTPPTWTDRDTLAWIAGNLTSLCVSCDRRTTTVGWLDRRGNERLTDGSSLEEAVRNAAHALAAS